MKRWISASIGLALITSSGIAAGGGVGVVPEIGGAGAITAIALLAGIVALVAERRRK